MKSFRLIQPFLLLIILQMGCRNTVSTEFGELTLNIEWSALEKTQIRKSLQDSLSQTGKTGSMKKTDVASTPSDTLPEISMVRITLEPGPIIYEFTEVLPAYSIQAELGIYNVLIEVMNRQGSVIFSADTTEILIKPPAQVQITLRIAPNYPTTAPEFTGWETMNAINSADYSLHWIHVAKADSFELEESTSPDFASVNRIYSGSDTTFKITDQTDGTYYYRVRAKNALAASPWSQVIGFQVTVAETLELLTTALPEAVFGVEYEASLCFSGGTPPYNWQMIDSALPPDLTASLFDSCIVITGVPTIQDQFLLIIDITDSGNPQQFVMFEGYLNIVQPDIEILNVTLTDGQVDQDYSECYTFPDNLTDHQWALSDYPAWMSVNIGTQICYSGTPDIAGDYSWTALGYNPDNPQTQTQIVFALHVTSAAPDLFIATNTLNVGTENQYYETTICASGGTAPYDYTIVQGVLPDGLTTTSATCLEIAGTPAESGVFSFIVEASDSDSPSASIQKAFIIEIEAAPIPLQITTQNLPEGQKESFYQQQICAEGGVLPFNWEITEGSLPEDLAIEYDEDGACITLTGTPTSSGMYPLTVQVTDSDDPQQTDSREFSITIQAPPLQILTESLPDGDIEVEYQQQVCAENGTQPYQWEITAGSLPDGLNAAGNGCFDITGTPTQAGEFQFTVQVTDSDDPQQTDSREFSITILAPPLQILTESLPDGDIEVEYQQQVCAENGTQPYQWEITEGSLPEGLNAAGNDCFDITGTPTQAGEFPLTVQVTDQSTPPQTHTRSYTLTIHPPALWITTGQIPEGAQNNYYTADINAQGGSGDWTWYHISGILPPGITFEDSEDHATVRGTPTTAGMYSFTVQVTDNVYAGLSETKRFSITIEAVSPFRIITTSLSNATVYDYYTDYLCAADGILPYSWDVISGSLPPNLYTGAPINECVDISGTPNSVGVYAFTVRVTDSDSPPKTATRAFSITVNPEPLVIYTTSPLEEGQLGEGYDDTICASGGSVDYSWSMTGGALPAGLSFTDMGECAHVTGTPTETGTFSITARVTDNTYPLSDTKVFELTITNP